MDVGENCRWRLLYKFKADIIYARDTQGYVRTLHTFFLQQEHNILRL